MCEGRRKIWLTHSEIEWGREANPTTSRQFEAYQNTYNILSEDPHSILCMYMRISTHFWTTIMMMMMIQKRGSTESVLTDFAQLRSRQPVAKGKEREKWEQKIICIIAVYYTVYIIKVRKYFSQRFTKKSFMLSLCMFLWSAVYHLYWYVYMYSSVSFYNRHIYKRK